MQTLGRLADPDEFGNIVVKQTAERGGAAQGRRRASSSPALDYSSNSYLDLDPAVAHRDLPAAGLERARDRQGHPQDRWTELSKRFPARASNTTSSTTRPQFIQQSVDAVIETILEAILLVVLVVVLFLQTWRAAIIPLVAIPVSLIGTFFLMAAFGFSLNNLSLFGLVLAIGIVVDDAIVVVENVERNIADGPDAARRRAAAAWTRSARALIAIALVLCAVFVPSAFITGISGQFYRQFALTIAGATVISLIVSLTLSPALCALLLKPHRAHAARAGWWERPLHGFFGCFNRGFDKLAHGLRLARRRAWCASP